MVGEGLGAELVGDAVDLCLVGDKSAGGSFLLLLWRGIDEGGNVLARSLVVHSLVQRHSRVVFWMNSEFLSHWQ